MSIAPRQRTCSHCQEYWLAARKTPSTQGISQKPIFSLTARTRKNCLLREQFPSLHSKCVAGTVLLKTDLLLSRVVDLSPGLCSTLLLQQSATLCVICALLLIFNKSLRTSSSIGPLLSCVIHHLILLVALLLPLPFLYFAQEQFDFQVFQLFRGSELPDFRIGGAKTRYSS